MLIAEQIATYLDEQAVGSYTPAAITGNILIDQISEEKETINILHRPGLKSDSKIGYQMGGIQIWYRGNKNPIQSYTKAKEIFDTLNGFNSDYFVAGENYICSCLSLQGAAERIGVDSNGNYEYSINFLVDYKEA